MTTTDPDFAEWRDEPDEQTHDELHEVIHEVIYRPEPEPAEERNP